MNMQIMLVEMIIQPASFSQFQLLGALRTLCNFAIKAKQLLIKKAALAQGMAKPYLADIPSCSRHLSGWFEKLDCWWQHD